MIWEMVAIHNIFIRGINTIYNQAIKVGESGTEADRLEFCEFAAVWSLGLHEHHGMEEDTVFPDIENVAGAKGIMETNVQQHEAFTGGLEKYDAYLRKVQGGEEKYDGRKLVAIIDDFGKLLAEHLSDEIVTLRGLYKYPDADWEGVTKRIEKRVMKEINQPGVKVNSSTSLGCSGPPSPAPRACKANDCVIDQVVPVRPIPPPQDVRER